MSIEELDVSSSGIEFHSPGPATGNVSLHKSLVSLSGSPEGVEKRTLVSVQRCDN